MITLSPENKFKYSNFSISFKKLAIINPHILKSSFISDNRFILDSDCVLIVKKIRNKQIRESILSLDEYRKRLDKERREKEYFTSSENIKSGDYNVFYTRRTNYLLYGI